MVKLKVIEHSDALTHVSLSGRLDVVGSTKVESEFLANTASKRKPTIVDLSGLEVIVSPGMGMLVSAATSLRDHGAGMVLLNPGEVVSKALRAVKLDQVIPIAESREQALELLDRG